MNGDNVPNTLSDRLMHELQAWRDEHERVWRGIDDVLVAKYLCDMATPEERDRIEMARQQSPEIAELLAIVSEFQTAATVPLRVSQAWSVVNDKLSKLVEKVEVWLEGVQGLLSKGLESLKEQRAIAAWSALGSHTSGREGTFLQWNIPLSPHEATLNLSVRPTSNRHWEVRARWTPPPVGTAPWVKVVDAQGNEEYSNRLESIEQSPLVLASGEWSLTVQFEGRGWEIPLVLKG